MKPPKFDYVAPVELSQALALLTRGGADARLLAGGQSLVPAMNFRLSRPSLLIDLNRVAELRGLRRADNGDLIAGAMTRHRDFELSPLVRELLPLAHAAMPGVAHLAIRNRGTIGGSLAHADPAGDWPALCLACDAQIALQSTHGTRSVDAESFGRGLFATALAEGEMLTEVRFPVWSETRSWGLQKMTRRWGDFAIVGAVCVADTDANGCCRRVRIVVYGASDCAQLVREAAGVIENRIPSAALLREAARAAAGAVNTRSDLHASAAYRTELVETLTRRALAQALPAAREAA